MLPLSPAILLWGTHYVVLTRVEKRGAYIVDPSGGLSADFGSGLSGFSRLPPERSPFNPLQESVDSNPLPKSVDGNAEQFLPADRLKPPWQGYRLVIRGKGK
jgi:hypothetical protein